MDTAGVTDVSATSEQAAPKNKRGRETAGDMVRSLGLVMIVVVAIWFFAQPPDSDEATIRVIDPAGDISAFRADVPQAGTPTFLPEQWRPTSSKVARGSLRIGYVTPSEQFAEYSAATLSEDLELEDLTGAGARKLAPVDVAGTAWEQYREGDGSLSLVRTYGSVTVVVGTLRSTAPLSELEVLARSVTVG